MNYSLVTGRPLFVEARMSLPSQDRPRGGRSHQPNGDPDPPDDSSDDEPCGPRKLPPPPRPRGNPKDISRGAEGKAAAEMARFDLKLKSEDIPEWDGNEDTLGMWILKLNALGQRSPNMFINS